MFSISKITVALVLVAVGAAPVAASAKTKRTAAHAHVRSVAATHHKAASTAKSPKATSKAASLKTTASKTTASSTHNGRHSKKVKLQTVSNSSSKPAIVKSVAKPKFHGQQSIDEARATEIQQALIREHYMEGEASGQWDQATRDALTRFQNDNHWQTKILPDSRALIKLGLGPSQQNLLNPQSAAIGQPLQSAIDKPSSGGSN